MDNIALLLNVFFFQGLDPDELLAIMALTRRQRYGMGQRICATGDPGDYLFIVKSGSVMVKNGAVVLATLGVGDTFGEMSFVDRTTRSATVAAIEETELLQIPFTALEQLLASQPVMAAKIYRTLASVLSQRLRTMSEMVGTRYQPVK